MRILYFNPTKKVRAGIDSLTAGFASGEHEVTVFLPTESRQTLKRRSNVTYEFYDAMYVPGVRYTLPKISFLRQLASRLSGKVDIIHTYSYFYFPCTIAVVLGRLLGAKTVVTVDSLPGINWSYGNTTVDVIGRAYTATLGRLTFSSADRVVALGEYLVDDLKQYAPRENIRVIPNGIDTSEYRIEQRKMTDQRDGVVKLLYVGRLDPVKGVPHLIAALAQLKEDEPLRYDLTIVGDGTKREQYERQCKATGIEDRVHFEGWQDDVTSYYVAADVFMLPSLSEGQPTVLLEAQASGLPVVTTDVGGASSLVAAGRVVPPRDDDALAAAIAEVGVEYTGKVAVDARESIVESFSTERMCTEYLRLYEEIIDSR